MTKPLHMVFVGDMPSKDYVAMIYDIRDDSASVFGCGTLLDTGFCLESHPVFVLMDIRDIRENVGTYETYRISWLESDWDRGYMKMGVEMIGRWGIDDLRRSVRIGRVLG
jgi:hypothetical protein